MEEYLEKVGIHAHLVLQMMLKKSNLATMHAWKLLRYTTLDTKVDNWEMVIAKEIKNVIETKE